MRKYKGENTKELLQITCNKCGKSLCVEKGIPKEGVITVEQGWGFFSDKDGTVHSFDLCEVCYDEFLKTFAIPAEVKEKTELI